MNTTNDGDGLRRVTGWLLVMGAVAFVVAATVLSSTFDWPDILREPPEVVLPAFVDGGTSLAGRAGPTRRCHHRVRARGRPFNGITSGRPLAAGIPMLATNLSPTDAMPTRLAARTRRPP
jgi:hypothetical protein